jgi:hypothetical protein
VTEAFRADHRGKAEHLAGLLRPGGHRLVARYACGDEDKSYAQPFEYHLQNTSGSLGFNGQRRITRLRDNRWPRTTTISLGPPTRKSSTKSAENSAPAFADHEYFAAV